MSRIFLPDIFTLLPEAHQREAIISALELMFAKGEWASVDDIVCKIMLVQFNVGFMARVISIGVRVALRMGNHDLAFERYGHFLGLCHSPEVAAIQAETLLQMAIQILPRMSGKLYVLWKANLLRSHSIAAQESVAKTGMLLAETFSKNNDSGMLKATRKIMQDNLNKAFVADVRQC